MKNNFIVTFFCLFGSIYTFNSTLMLINYSLLQDKKVPIKLNIINGMTLVISGSIYIYIVFI
jgi:hypothetical protein